MADDHEMHRHRCEVRQVLKWRASEGRKRVDAYFLDVAKHRGQTARQDLERECIRQWERGNRGEAGDWY